MMMRALTLGLMAHRQHITITGNTIQRGHDGRLATGAIHMQGRGGELHGCGHQQ